jgi:integrase
VSDREQAAAYLDAASAEYRTLAELLMRTGLRIGEALALEWRDVDTEALTLRVSRSHKCDGSSGGTKTDRRAPYTSARTWLARSTSTAA